jgi:hypothetical protein
MSRRSLLAAVLAAVFSLSAPLLSLTQAAVVRMFFFYSPGCSHCQAVMNEVLPLLQQKYGSQLEIRYFDMEVTSNYRALLDLETRYQVSTPDVPEAFVGSHVLLGEPEIRAKLDSLIAEALLSGGVDYPVPGLEPATAPPPAPTLTPPSAATVPGRARVYLAYFYDASCRECDRVRYDLEMLQRNYANLEVRSFDTTQEAVLCEALGQRYGIPSAKRLVAPVVFVGNDYLVAPDISLDAMATLVDKYSAQETKPPWVLVGEQGAETSIIDRFRSFSALTVIGAALIDGINPCAFAGIIFFVSYLAVTKRKGSTILAVGAAFTVGVFLSYLLLGLGILRFVEHLSFIHVLARLVYGITAVVCLLLAALNLRDYVLIRRGRRDDVSLRLPKPLQERVHRVIREQSRVRQYVAAAFATGFLVSLIEFACTGQVYLPTIIFVTGVPGLRNHAILYLILYNLLFVAPLILIFLLTYFGTTWRNLNQFLESNMSTIKLASAILFVLLAAWLGLYII